MMEPQLLNEYISPVYTEQEVSESVDKNNTKNYYMKGIFLEGDIKNGNGRIYPTSEISKAVSEVNNRIKNGESVFGEADHPNGLQINLDRISHVITEMWIDGSKGLGKLKLLNTPCGQIVQTILSAGCKLGVSSRGNGYVNENTGYVQNFQIITVDIVVNPSAPNAYPTAVYEKRGVSSIFDGKRGNIIHDLASSAKNDEKAQKYLKEEVISWITNLSYSLKK